MNIDMTFEEIYEQNKRRIYFYIHKLNIQDPHQEFFQLGLTSLWRAYRTYLPYKGSMSTYFNYIIRNSLIDQLRKQKRYQTLVKEHLSFYETFNHTQAISNVYYDNQIDNSMPHMKFKSHLTENQWNWLHYCVIQDMTHEELATLKNTTKDAVKSWARQARKKLRIPEIRELLIEE